jgi:hypothetical protein
MNQSYRHYYPDLLTWEYNLVSNGWKFCGEGRHRRVIRRGNVIIKIPHKLSGMKANKQEASLYKGHFNQPNKETGVYYAPCRLLSNGCLMMRHVNVLDDLDPCQKHIMPKWAINMEDGPQVGYSKSHKLMAFDYSDEFYY